METDFVSISTLNDFVFCPYSIYLHNVYMESDDDIYHASPQIRGCAAHNATEHKTFSTSAAVIQNLPIYSEKLRLMGKIDIYRIDKKLLIERKYKLKQIYKGQKYQLWAQMLCMKEMGYEIEHIAFYETSTNRMIYIDMPNQNEEKEFVEFVQSYLSYNPGDQIETNENKCCHCIYCNLCDKTTNENVYS